LLAKQKRWYYITFGEKICRSISPTKFKPNLCTEIHQTLFALLPKEPSHLVRLKKP